MVKICLTIFLNKECNHLCPLEALTAFNLICHSGWWVVHLE
jgi:hypothetical protein